MFFVPMYFTVCLFFHATLYLGHVRELQLQLSEVLAAVGVSPHSGGWWDGSAGVRVDAPALAPLTVERHLALEHKMVCCSSFIHAILDNRDNPKYACLCVNLWLNRFFSVNLSGGDTLCRPPSFPKCLDSPAWGYTAPSCHSWGCAGHTGLPGDLGCLWRASWISSPGSGRAPADTESWKQQKQQHWSCAQARIAEQCIRVTRFLQ